MYTNMGYTEILPINEDYALHPSKYENATNNDKNYRIRQLSPKEAFRLMGVKDEDFEKIQKNQGVSSLFHLAGDSIIVDVLMAIFKEMI